MTRAALVALTLATASLAHADAGKLHAGQWQITSTSSMGGTRTEEKCITPDQAKDPKSQVRTPPGCETSDIKATGNGVHWALTCHMAGGTQTGQGDTTYSYDAMTSDGTITIEIPNHGKQTLTMHSEGKRIGDCK